ETCNGTSCPSVRRGAVSRCFIQRDHPRSPDSSKSWRKDYRMLFRFVLPLRRRSASRGPVTYQPQLDLLEDRLPPGQVGMGEALVLSLFEPELTAMSLGIGTPERNRPSTHTRLDGIENPESASAADVGIPSLTQAPAAHAGSGPSLAEREIAVNPISALAQEHVAGSGTRD